MAAGMPAPEHNQVAIDFLPQAETLDTQVVYLPVPKAVGRLTGDDRDVNAQCLCMAASGLVIIIVSFALLFTQ